MSVSFYVHSILKFRMLYCSSSLKIQNGISLLLIGVRLFGCSSRLRMIHSVMYACLHVVSCGTTVKALLIVPEMGIPGLEDPLDCVSTYRTRVIRKHPNAIGNATNAGLVVGLAIYFLCLLYFLAVRLKLYNLSNLLYALLFPHAAAEL